MLAYATPNRHAHRDPHAIRYSRVALQLSNLIIPISETQMPCTDVTTTPNQFKLVRRDTQRTATQPQLQHMKTRQPRPRLTEPKLSYVRLRAGMITTRDQRISRLILSLLVFPRLSFTLLHNTVQSPFACTNVFIVK